MWDYSGRRSNAVCVAAPFAAHYMSRLGVSLRLAHRAGFRESPIVAVLSALTCIKPGIKNAPGRRCGDSCAGLAVVHFPAYP